MPERNQPSSHGRGRASARSTRGAFGVPGVAGITVQVVLSYTERSALRRVRSKGQQEASTLEGGDHMGIGKTYTVTRSPGTEGGRPSLNIGQVLYRHWHTVEGAEVLPPHNGLLSRTRFRTQLLVTTPNHRIDLGVNTVGALQVVVDHLDRA